MKAVRKVLFIISLLINVFLSLQIFADISGWNLNYFFNSDGLYLASIYKDLFVDNNQLEGWHLNAAPNFFPEWPVYFLVRFISGDFRIAALIYALISIISINLISALILKTAASGINYSYLALSNLGYTIFLLFYLKIGDFINTAYLFQTGYHLGVFLMFLLALWFFLRYLNSGTTPSLVGLFLVVLLGVLSDRLLLMFFIVPSFSAAFFVYEKQIRKRIIRALLISLAGALLGILLYFAIKASDFVHIIDLGKKFTNFSNILPSLNNYIQVMAVFLESGSFKTLAVLTSVVSLIAGIFLSFCYTILRKEVLSANRNEKILISLLTVFIIVVTLTPILNGYFLGMPQLRFNIFALYIGVFLFVLLIYLITRHKKELIIAIDLLTIILIGLTVTHIIANEKDIGTIKGIRDFANHYPEEVRLIDEVSLNNDLDYGVGNYWWAKRITLFSKNNVRVLTVNNKIKPWYHVTNEHWYYGYENNPRPVFNFILLNDFTPQGSFYEQLKTSSDTIVNKNLKILEVPAFGFDKQARPFIYEK